MLYIFFSSLPTAFPMHMLFNILHSYLLFSIDSHTRYRSCLSLSASSFLATTNATSDPTATTTVATMPIAAPIVAKPRRVKHVYPVNMDRYMTRKKSRKRLSGLDFIVLMGYASCFCVAIIIDYVVLYVVGFTRLCLRWRRDEVGLILISQHGHGNVEKGV
jgi:hypothetical protein